jgi:hypothetical protein
MSPQQIRDRRIAGAWSDFSAYSPEIQDKIRQGQVDVGFTQPMVRLALGGPDRIFSRKTGAGLSTIWSYLGWTPSSRYEYVMVPAWYRGDHGRYWSHYETVGVTVDNSREYERIRIEFRDGTVQAVESLQP